jgi:hypothetical protein
MKKLIALLLICSTTAAMAQHGFRHHHGYYSGYGWVAPTVIGGVIGYEIARTYPPVVVQQQPIVVQPAPAYYGHIQICTDWVEVQQPDSTITRTRTCKQ